MKSPQRWIDAAVESKRKSCLRWPGTIATNGYGRLYVGRYERRLAHREVCRRAHGEPPTPQHHAAHSCNNRACVNPSHLRWATCRENLADRLVHGTLRKGDSHPRTKYSEAALNELVIRYWRFVAETAAELGIPKDRAHKILRGAARTTGE